MDHSILHKLAAGDMRTTGRAEEVAKEALDNPGILGTLVEAVQHTEPGVRMRAADALEKVSKSNPGLLQAYTHTLLLILKQSAQQEVQWHMAQIIPRLTLSRNEQVEAYALLSRNYQESNSSIVRTWSLQAMADLTSRLPENKNEVERMAEEALNDGTPAMKSRAKNILKKLSRP